MDTKTLLSPEKISRVAEILKTISHPVRLEIMLALREQEPLCVGDLQSIIPIEVEQSMLSHHLIKMKDKGVLRCEKKGMHVYYTLNDRHILSIFECMSKCDLV
jgi:DNA-binding transcriptional ArsR family regulator